MRRAPARPPSARPVDTPPSWAARRPPSAVTVPPVARAWRAAWRRQCAALAPSPTKPTRLPAPPAPRASTSPPQGRRVASRALPAPIAFAAPRRRARAVRAPMATSPDSPTSAAASNAPQAAHVPQALSSPRYARPAPTPTRQTCHHACDARPGPIRAARAIQRATSAPNHTGARRAARRPHRARPAPMAAAKGCSAPSSAPNAQRARGAVPAC